MPRRLILAVAAIGFATAALAETQVPPLKIAVFRFEIVDRAGATDPETAAAEQGRLDLITDYMRQKLAESEHYELVDMAGIHALEDKRLADPAIEGYLFECDGCEAEIAAALGADVALLGIVTKVTPLVLTISVFMRDAGTGQLTVAHRADIRGNTDRTWMHGISGLVRNRLLKDTGE